MPINYNVILCVDFETSSPYAHTTQPLEIASVAIHSRSLEIIPGSQFSSLICPSEPEKVEDGALRVNRLCVGPDKTGGHEYNPDRDVLKAPPLNIVWQQFTDYVKKYNYKNNSYTSPILAGYNINNFDKIIIDRICKQFKQWDDTRQCNTLFSSFKTIDLMDVTWLFFEDCNNTPNIKLTTICEKVGLDISNSHAATTDVQHTAQLIARFMGLIRRTSKRVKWKSQKNVES